MKKINKDSFKRRKKMTDHSGIQQVLMTEKEKLLQRRKLKPLVKGDVVSRHKNDTVGVIEGVHKINDDGSITFRVIFKDGKRNINEVNMTRIKDKKKAHKIKLQIFSNNI